ncbi:MAG: glycosyltransferase family 39 protein [Candidatus Xenobium sp.]|nr:hypothetical protein [Burkholderiales bacterium]
MTAPVQGGPHPLGGRLSFSWVMVALIAVAGALRLVELGAASLTVDEGVGAFVAFLASREPAGIPALMREIHEVHPPGWFLALHFWGRLGHSEAWLRASSALAGVLAVPVTVWLGTELRGGRGGLRPGVVMAGLLLATSAWHIQYSRELRMYPLLGLLVLGHLVAFLRFARSGGRGWLALSAVFAAAAFWVHSFGFFAPVLSGLWTLRHRRDRMAAWLGASGLALLFFGPWVPSLLGQLGAQDLELRGRPGGWALPELAGRMASADLLEAGAPIYLFLGTITLAFVLAALRLNRGLDPLLWLVFPPLLAWVVSQFTPLRVFEFKYFVWCAPFLALLQGEVLDPPGRWTRCILWGLVSVHLVFWGLLLLHPSAANQDWRAVATEIRRDAPVDAVILVQPSMMAAPLLYYGVPPTCLTPLDIPNQDNLKVLRGHQVVWLVTTPNHPLVVRTGLEEALDQVLWRERGRQRPDKAWLPSACTRVVRYRGERPPRAEVSPRLALSSACTEE